MSDQPNWDQIYEWDNKYYFHVKQAADEYRFIPVDHTEGNYVYLANGMKVLDFCSQVIPDEVCGPASVTPPCRQQFWIKSPVLR